MYSVVNEFDTMETPNLHIRSILKITGEKNTNKLIEVTLGKPLIKLELSLKFDF